jgi:GNAT superfamily N-acetyltransferase
MIGQNCGGDMRNGKIRPAQEKDAATLTECIDAAYAIYKNRINDLPAVSEGIPNNIATHLVWVAELDQSVVGGLILILEDEFAILANVAVDPKHAGLGFGRGLIERAEKECCKLGLRELRLSTHAGMPENVRLYEHLGWEETGRTGNKIHMTKRL